jgi:exosome complex component RRP46
VVLLFLHPRTMISIVVQVVNDDGSLLSCAVNAVSLALMDAGVAMGALAMSSTCALLADGSVVMDPVEEEEAQAAGVVTTAYSSVDEGVLASLTAGVMSEEKYFECAAANRRAGEAAMAFVRLAIKQKMAQADVAAQ